MYTTHKAIEKQTQLLFVIYLNRATLFFNYLCLNYLSLCFSVTNIRCGSMGELEASVSEVPGSNPANHQCLLHDSKKSCHENYLLMFNWLHIHNHIVGW